ncbi:MAG: insulinase family protein [Microscillaceae bacterium]|nr:insulinase family protein [Microscillaceae bacterium]
MLNRNQAPPYQTMRHLQIPRLQTHTLSNDIKVHTLNTGVQEVFKMEVVFGAGSCYESVPGISYFTVKMLAEGTHYRSALQINEYIDGLGGFSEFNHGTERISVALFGLSRHLPAFFELLREILLEPSFPEQELVQIKKLAQQNLAINLEKNAFLASKKFRELIFGENHPYARHLSQPLIDQTQRANIAQHYNTHIFQQPFDLILVGSFAENDLRQILLQLEQWPIAKNDAAASLDLASQPSAEKNFLLSRPDKLQSSLRLGCPLFSKSHPDYLGLSLLNEIFGGYYGSRLMKNIREQKGYTYGIYANLAALRRGGYWIIGTDVKKEFTAQTLQEIHYEARKLRDEKIGQDELQTVRNYMMGSLAGSLNTPFELAEIFKSVYFHDLGYEFYDHYIEAIHQLSPAQLQAIAQEYLLSEDFWEVVVGEK